MQYAGFVYLWWDRKRSMFYIGSHMGSKDDGYICSNTRMLSAYRKRPSDFKRFILHWELSSDPDVLYAEEERWLSFVTPGLFYNIKKVAKGWPKGKKRPLSTRRKMSNRWTVGLPTTFIHKDGWKKTVWHIGDFCKKHGLNPSAISQVRQGKRKTHLGFRLA